MSTTVRVLRAAADEARAAWRWYRERDRDAADGFLAEYDRVLHRIADAPERWPAYLFDTRRLVMRRFPFSVIYRPKSELVEVIAVAHQQRMPGYWLRR